jgi:hypothetical protein
VSAAGGLSDRVSRMALYQRVVEAPERSAELAEHHAQREHRDGRPATPRTNANAHAAPARSPPEPARCWAER